LVELVDLNDLVDYDLFRGQDVIDRETRVRPDRRPD